VARLGIGRAGLLALVLLGAACGDDAAPIFPNSAQSEQSTATFVQPTTTFSQPITTSVSAGTEVVTTTVVTTTTSTTTVVEPVPVDPLDDPAAILDLPPAGGLHPLYEQFSRGPDTESTAAFTDVLTDTGVDLTGIEVWVWPVTDSDEVLLIFNFDDTAAGLQEDPEGLEILGEALLSPVLETSGVTRLVINYSGIDEEGPFTLTAAVPFDASQLSSLGDGAEPAPEEDWLFHLARE